ncbi:MAG: transglycosylase domain-containing protein [Bacteroidia bacterium]
MRKLKSYLLYFAALFLVVLLTIYIWLSVKWKENVSKQEFEKFEQEILNTPEFPEKVYSVFSKIYLYDENTSTWDMLSKRIMNPNKRSGCACMDTNYPFERETINRVSLALKLDKTVGPKKCIDFFLESCLYSNGKQGFSQASEFFFNKSASDLGDNEIASLILMTKAPTLYDFRRNPEIVNKEINKILSQ